MPYETLPSSYDSLSSFCPHTNSEYVFQDSDNKNENNTNSTEIMSYPQWLGSSEKQYNQFLTDSYNYFETSKGNRVWACAMSLAWNQLKRGLLNGQNVNFLNTTELQQKMVDNLNSEIFTKSQINQDSYYVASGFGQETVDRINYQVRQKFPSRTFLPLNYNLQSKDFISFAYLFKNFKFQTPFAKVERFYFNDKKVEGFESKTSKHRKQLFYKYYNNSDDFMVGIRTENPNDEILLWKTNKTGLNDMKFQKILRMIDFYSSMPSLNLTKSDKFIMPVIDLEYDRTYKELLDMRFSNPGLENYVVSELNQKVKIKVTKYGVTLENQAVSLVSYTSFFFSQYFALDSDFWLIMKEKNKKPYLVTLIRDISETWKA